MTGPTKCSTVNASRGLSGLRSSFDPLCASKSLSSMVWSVPFRTTHSSLRACRMPFGRPPMSLTTAPLSISEKSASGSSMPSAAFSSCTDVNTASLNVFCNRSLQKLMHSCSRELTSKVSKPKMSRMPMNCCVEPSPPPPPPLAAAESAAAAPPLRRRA